MSRELDYEIAEKLFGWEWQEWEAPGGRVVKSIVPAGYTDGCINSAGEGVAWKDCPKFTTDPAADYQVLCHVREKWPIEDIEEFHAELKSIWHSRCRAGRAYWRMLPVFLEPGDYSRAALSVLTAREGGKGDG